MLKTICQEFLKIQLLDQILLIVLTVSVIAKGVYEIVCWHLCKHYNTDKHYKEKCIYLANENKQECQLVKCKEKYFVNKKCNKEKCPGYRISNFSIEDIKQLHKFWFLLCNTLKWVSEIATVILIARTLINSI